MLTKKAAENPRARAIYEQGIADGQSFEQIERQLGEALPNLKSPLVPKNVAWFTVRGQDFPNPEVACQILEAYGEDRGDGIRRLYRFPVVFPSDVWQTVMPHELVAWGANEKKFWSEYSPDGRVRYCKRYAPAPLNDTGRRVIRVFGGRKAVPRSENGGLCDPENCGEYQQRQCNLAGRFIFFIPGIRSLSAFELHTNSFYAMNAAIQKFETIAFMRGGRISGFLDARRTPFYITKKLMEVSHIDEAGRAMRVKQWIIELEAPIDVTALLRSTDDEETVLINADLASQILEGPGGAADVARAQPVSSNPDRRTAAAPQEFGAADVDKDAEQAKEQLRASHYDNGLDAGTGNSRPVATENNKSPSHAQVIAAACSFGIDGARYEQYADRRWGCGWKVNAGGRRRALEELERYRNDPEGYLDKIETELTRLA